MKRTYIKDLKEETCLVKGYIEIIRDQKQMQFILLRDVTGVVQVTVVKSEQPEIAEIFTKLTRHSFVDIEGKCVSAPQVKICEKEIYPTKVVVQSIAEALPIDENSSVDLKMDYQWITLRSELKVLCFKIQTAFEKYAIEYFTKNGFIEIHTPKITGLSSEGGSEVFELKDYFKQKAYLTQSPQLYKQMSMMAGFDKTFEIGEYFRANPSFTSRHDTEFTCIDVEISFIDSFADVMDCEEELLKYALTRVYAEYSGEYKKILEREMPKITEEAFPRIPLLEVYKILEKEYNYIVPRHLKGDLDPEGERLISQYAKEKFNSDFVFVTSFPVKARAFYTMKNAQNPELGECFDLIYKGNEITSGAQREHRYEQLKERIKENGINPDSMTQYLTFFRYGVPTHGGFGLGITRVLTKLFDFPSVKDVTFLFRGPNRLMP